MRRRRRGEDTMVLVVLVVMLAHLAAEGALLPQQQQQSTREEKVPVNNISRAIPRDVVWVIPDAVMIPARVPTRNNLRTSPSPSPCEEHYYPSGDNCTACLNHSATCKNSIQCCGHDYNICRFSYNENRYRCECEPEFIWNTSLGYCVLRSGEDNRLQFMTAAQVALGAALVIAVAALAALTCKVCSSRRQLEAARRGMMDTDTQSLNSVQRFVLRRLRDRPPRYEDVSRTLPDKPPPYSETPPPVPEAPAATAAVEGEEEEVTLRRPAPVPHSAAHRLFRLYWRPGSSRNSSDAGPSSLPIGSISSTVPSIQVSQPSPEVIEPIPSTSATSPQVSSTPSVFTDPLEVIDPCSTSTADLPEYTEFTEPIRLELVNTPAVEEGEGEGGVDNPGFTSECHI